MRSSFQELSLHDGTSIWLVRFSVSLTYADLLEGKITDEVNSMVLSFHRDFLHQSFPDIPAIMLKLQNAPGQALPELRFVGEFEVGKVDAISEAGPATFAAMWYQSELTPLMSPDNAALLSTFTWGGILSARMPQRPPQRKSWFKRGF